MDTSSKRRMRNGLMAMVVAVASLAVWLTLATDPVVDSAVAVGVALPAETDLIDEFRAANSRRRRLPAEFRAGTVKPRTLPPDAVSRTDTGFAISLPSGTPVPTPLVHAGCLYVSGGFSSKELYCLNATSGAFLWGAELDDDGPSSAVLQDDTVIFNTESCTIFALDSRTGEMRWSYWLGDPLMSIPAVANGKVFAVYPPEAVDDESEPDDPTPPQAPKPGAADDRPHPQPYSHALICIELRTGRILWQRWIDSDCLTGPVAAGDAVYVTTFSGNFYAFSQTEGEIRTARRLRATSAPTISGKHIFITRRSDGGQDGAVVREAMVMLDRRGTSELYVANDRQAPYLDSTIQERAESAKFAGKIEATNGIMGGFGGGFFAVEDSGSSDEDQNETGREPAAEQPKPQAPDKLAEAQLKAAGNIGQGNVAVLQSFQGSRILNSRELNFNCMGDVLIGSRALTGRALWTLPLDGDLEREGGHLAAPPVAAADRLFLATLQGDVLQIVPKTGEIERTYHVGSPIRFAPTIEGGHIYVGTQDGKLVCIDTGDPRFTGWPMSGGNAGHTCVDTAGHRR